MTKKTLVDLYASSFVRCLPRNHDEVQTNQWMLMIANSLSYPTLQPIAPHRFSGHSSGDGDAEARATGFSFRRINGKQLIIATASICDRPAVILAV